jgi:hypothetical protein
MKPKKTFEGWMHIPMKNNYDYIFRTKKDAKDTLCVHAHKGIKKVRIEVLE